MKKNTVTFLTFLLFCSISCWANVAPENGKPCNPPCCVSGGTGYTYVCSELTVRCTFAARIICTSTITDLDSDQKTHANACNIQQIGGAECKVRIGDIGCEEICNPCSLVDSFIDICGGSACTQTLANYLTGSHYDCYCQEYVFSR